MSGIAGNRLLLSTSHARVPAIGSGARGDTAIQTVPDLVGHPQHLSETAARATRWLAGMAAEAVESRTPATHDIKCAFVAIGGAAA